jgi:hypothetical protein
MTYICQLPESVQNFIVRQAILYLSEQRDEPYKIEETIENIKNEKICNVLTEDGNWIG